MIIPSTLREAQAEILNLHEAIGLLRRLVKSQAEIIKKQQAQLNKRTRQ
jgi:hypothetical protein